MKILPVKGGGKCIECGKTTTTQMWVGRMQFFFCEKCVSDLSVESTRFMNEYKKEMLSNITVVKGAKKWQNK